MVKEGQELDGFPTADDQLGLHSCLLLPVDVGCIIRAQVGEDSSSHPPTSLPNVDYERKSQNEFRQQPSSV